MKLLAAIALLALSLTASADTARIGSRIVTTGMTTAEVIDRVGHPTVKQDITNAYGAVLGQRWEYHQGAKMITLWVQFGKVVRVDEQ